MLREHTSKRSNKFAVRVVSIPIIWVRSDYSVLDVVHTFERITGREIPYEVVARRVGDVAECFADARRANTELKWEAQHTLEEMCRDAWRWHLNDSEVGYE